MEQIFEGYNSRIEQINSFLREYQVRDIYEAKSICLAHGLNVSQMIQSIQPTSFDNAFWAYIVGAAIAIKKGQTSAVDIANTLGDGLQAFCVPGTVADLRKVGQGHGQLGARLLDENTRCFGVVAGHETFTAPKSAIEIVKSINRVRVRPIKVVLIGFGGSEPADVVARINGFTHVVTSYDSSSHDLVIVDKQSYSDDERSRIYCYGVESELEGIAVLHHEGVDLAITGNTANAVRFQHIVVSTYKRECHEENRSFFSVASGGGTGRTLHPDNTGAGPGTYGMTDKMGRMHGDVQFAGSSSVPAHVEMMGFIGMGNNAIVGATCSVTVAVKEALECVASKPNEAGSALPVAAQIANKIFNSSPGDSPMCNERMAEGVTD